MSDASQGPGWWQASDGKWYPPEQHPSAQAQQQQPQPPPPPPGYPPPHHQPAKSGSSVWKVLAIVGGVMLLLTVGCVAIVATSVDEALDEAESGPEIIDGVASNSGNETNPPQADLGEVDCTTDDLGFMEATVRVTNNSSERSNYSIDIVFETQDGSEQLDSTGAFVSDLEPGQSTTAEAGTFVEPPAEGFTRRIIEVDRYSS